jgi:F-type H+-transporting ATPase subunit delta
MTTGSLARRYARAILDLAVESNQIDRVGRELSELAKTWSESPSLQELFSNPQFGSAARKAVLTEIATRSAVSPLVKNSVLYLSDKQRLSALPDIARVFATLAEEKAGTVRALVTSAALLPDAYYTQLQRALEDATGKRVSIDKQTDPSLIGGVVTRVGDQVFDGSIRTRLNDIKESLRPA